MNSSSKLLLSFFLSTIPCSSLCSDNGNQIPNELHGASRSTAPRNMVFSGLLTAALSAVGYSACEHAEEFLCGTHSENPTFSPCTGNETNKSFYARMIYAGLMLAATGSIVQGYQKLSELAAQEKKGL